MINNGIPEQSDDRITRATDAEAEDLQTYSPVEESQTVTNYSDLRH